jgi:hypothetical protein
VRTFRLLAVLLGIIAILLGLRIFGRSYSSTRWPVTPGRVVRSSVVQVAEERFAPIIEYEFILAGRTYRGSGIRRPAGAAPDTAGSALSSRPAADSIAARFPAGRELLVGYDPGDPAQSVLEPELRWWALGLAIAGASLLGAGILTTRLRG